jgi:pyruvate dehydrogenase E2 component (dihydrolipoamide acetyltransferase)
MVKIKAPDFGEGLTDGILIEWRKKEGDTVKNGETLCDVETAKATTEILSSCNGKVKELLVKPKSLIKSGDVVCTIDSEEESDSGSVFSPKSEQDEDLDSLFDKL